MNEKKKISRYINDDDCYDNATENKIENDFQIGDKVRINEDIDYYGKSIPRWFMPIPLDIHSINRDSVRLGVLGEEKLLVNINNIRKVH